MPPKSTGAPAPILLMAHSLGQGGGERQLAQTALSIDRGRFTPHVAFCQGGFWVERLQQAGVPMFRIGSRSLMSVKAAREARRLRQYIRDHAIGIAQTFDFSMNMFGIPAARSAGGVVTIANLRCHLDLIPPLYRLLNRGAFRISDGVVVNSEALRLHLSENCRIAPEKIFTCYNGLDTEVFQPGPRRCFPGLEGASVVIGTVCVMRPEKNLALLLEAFATVAEGRRDLRLFLVGGGAEEAALRALADKLGIVENCVFHAATPDVAACLSAMDIFVLPSVSEGLSNSLMEAMACGCCAIASNVGGNPELVTHGTTGLLFPSRDRAALIEQLSAVVADAGRRRELASAAAARMQAEFSLDRSAQRMQQIYDALSTCVS
jgi:glycosyltransferase involved in cell wall biosynthesis